MPPCSQWFTATELLNVDDATLRDETEKLRRLTQEMTLETGDIPAKTPRNSSATWHQLESLVEDPTAQLLGDIVEEDSEATAFLSIDADIEVNLHGM